jgi:FAD:protein FMN transferase
MTSAATAHSRSADTASWPVWSTTAVVVVTDPAALDAARAIVERELDAVDRAASRFRPDSELNQLHRAAGSRQHISATLADLVGTALAAAAQTGGDVDPTLGAALARLGYDQDFAQVRYGTGSVRISIAPSPGWQRVRLDGDRLTIPRDIQLDLGATAKARTADRCAELVAARTNTGVLVSLGGDIATAGEGPAGGWRVLVQDQAGDPAQVVTLPAGHAIATSSTVSRQWRRDGRQLHHILDPRTWLPAEPVWRSATVAAATCTEANTLSTAALVRGHAAPQWLRGLGVPARLVTQGRDVLTMNWPRDLP